MLSLEGYSEARVQKAQTCSKVQGSNDALNGATHSMRGDQVGIGGSCCIHEAETESLEWLYGKHHPWITKEGVSHQSNPISQHGQVEAVDMADAANDGTSKDQDKCFWDAVD